MTRAGAVLAAIVALLLPGLGRASCGADHCPLEATAHHRTGQRFSLDLSYQFADQDRVRIGTRSGAIGELASPEDEIRTLNRSVTLRGDLRVAERWVVTGSLPYVARVHEHIANEEGHEPERVRWGYSGLGDLTLLTHWLPSIGAPGSDLTLSVQAGFKVPTGRRHVDAVDGEEPEPPARPGTGSWDALAGLHLMRGVKLPDLAGVRRPAALFTSVLVRANGSGTDGYRVGNVALFGIGGSYPLTGGLGLLGQINAEVRGRDDVGRTDSTPENTGGTLAFVSPGLEWRGGAAGRVYGYVQIPVYQRVNRIQIVSPYRLLVGVRRPFSF